MKEKHWRIYILKMCVYSTINVSICVVLGRKIKVQFCTDPLSRVIYYETDR